MQSALLFFILLSYSGWVNGLCDLVNGTMAHCHELEDVKYIETYDLESLKAFVSKPILHPGLFVNLTSLRHLDLSKSGIEGIESKTFRQLKNLHSLDLSENLLESLELGSIDGLNHLHKLDLRKNNFQQLPPVLARLKILKYLDIQGNPLQCNCATLRVRDLILKRGVKIMKKVLCVGPGNLKGTSLFKVDTTIVCRFEEQDREMQNDQSYKDSEDEFGSGDENSGEFEEILNGSSESPKEIEIETPFPNDPEVSTPSIIQSSFPETSESLQTSNIESAATTQMMLIETVDKDEQIFFGSEEKTSTAVAPTERKKEYVDHLFHPAEGSGDEEGSGEGSGTGEIFGDWTRVGEVERTSEKDEESSSSSNGLIDMFFNWISASTEAPSIEKDPDLEEEQFIDVTTMNVEAVTRKVHLDEAVSSTTERIKDGTMVPLDGVEIVDTELHDKSKLGNVKVDDGDELTDESAEVSQAKQSKKGMGSYVVLAALLAILATLIGFAAYKGDFCKKKRKRGDVEHGTELKDMQKALLETGNSTQPKVASNGNVESSPLVQDADQVEIKSSDDRQTTIDVSKPPNTISERTEPVKPIRNSQNVQRLKDTIDESSSLNDDSSSARISSVDVIDNCPVNGSPEVHGPPLSPGAQRVKITLQENPDSVPKTPILITRTMAGENLVKTP
nr:uncharacterized protein LOC117606853 [Osmia lignaria]XP_034185708.1 uncharacterized protein LOC117606853 [Osmia lignaria]